MRRTVTAAAALALTAGLLSACTSEPPASSSTPTASSSAQATTSASASATPTDAPSGSATPSASLAPAQVALPIDDVMKTLADQMKTEGVAKKVYSDLRLLTMQLPDKQFAGFWWATGTMRGGDGKDQSFVVRSGDQDEVVVIAYGPGSAGCADGVMPAGARKLLAIDCAPAKKK